MFWSQIPFNSHSNNKHKSTNSKWYVPREKENRKRKWIIFASEVFSKKLILNFFQFHHGNASSASTLVFTELEVIFIPPFRCTSIMNIAHLSWQKQHKHISNQSPPSVRSPHYPLALHGKLLRFCATLNYVYWNNVPHPSLRSYVWIHIIISKLLQIGIHFSAGLWIHHRSGHIAFGRRSLVHRLLVVLVTTTIFVILHLLHFQPLSLIIDPSLFFRNRPLFAQNPRNFHAISISQSQSRSPTSSPFHLIRFLPRYQNFSHAQLPHMAKFHGWLLNTFSPPTFTTIRPSRSSATIRPVRWHTAGSTTVQLFTIWTRKWTELPKIFTETFDPSALARFWNESRRNR